MIRNINLTFLWIFISLLLFSAYKLIFSASIYPYSLLMIGTLLAIGMFLSLYRIKKRHSSIYTLFSVIGILNCGLICIDYFSAELLKSTWNISFAIFFLLIFYGFVDRLKQFQNVLATPTLFVLYITCALILIALLFKLDQHFIHQTITYLFAASTIAYILTSVLNLRTKIQ
jgi:hypothetical protein